MVKPFLSFKLIQSLMILVTVFLLVPAGAVSKKTGAFRASEDSKTCDSSKTQGRFEGSFCEALFYIRPRISPLKDVRDILQNADVVLFGDTHPNILIKTWLARNLDKLKAAGFTHVALEALNSESQHILDGYLQNKISRTQLIKLVAEDWGWIPEEHVKLIDAIQAAGLKVIAIDNRNELDRAGHGNNIQMRNDHMSDLIESAFHEKGAGRVAVLTGKLHSALVSSEVGITTLPQILAARGMANLSYDLESTEEYAPKDLIQAFISELKANKLSPSVEGDYFLPTPVQDSDVHGVVFISR